MRYSDEYSSQASSYLRRADRKTRERIVTRVAQLCGDPFDHRISKALHGRMAGVRGSRIGEIRLTYHVVEDRLVVLVVRIGPRGDVYKS